GGVHEVVVAGLVEELHLLLVEGGSVDAVLRPEAVLGLGAGLQVAELRLDHAAPVAWRDVGDVHDAPERVLVLDGHARAELRGGDQGHRGLLRRERAVSRIAYHRAPPGFNSAWAPSSRAAPG